MGRFYSAGRSGLLMARPCFRTVRHQRRRVVHVAVTAHLTAFWTAQQLRQAFPEDEAPSDFLHDRDRALAALAATASGMSIETIRTALVPRGRKIGCLSPSFVPPNSA